MPIIKHPGFQFDDERDFKMQFEYVGSLLKEAPVGTKVYRGTHENSMSEEDFGILTHSFIKIDGPPHILALASNKNSNVLGRGAYGRVKIAVDVDGNLYAVKIVHVSQKQHTHKLSSSAASSYQSEQLHDEQQTLKDLNIGVGNVVKRTDNEKCYLVEKFLGDNLRHYLQHTELTLMERVELALAITQKVDELHKGLATQSGTALAHRDLKPDNLTIHPITKEIHIIDFGTAQSLTPSTFSKATTSKESNTESNSHETSINIPSSDSDSSLMLDMLDTQNSPEQAEIQASSNHVIGTPLYMMADVALYEKQHDKDIIFQSMKNNLRCYPPDVTDLFALKRILYLPKTLRSNKQTISVFDDKTFSELPKSIQTSLNTEHVNTTSMNENVSQLHQALKDHRENLVTVQSINLSQQCANTIKNLRKPKNDPNMSNDLENNYTE